MTAVKTLPGDSLLIQIGDGATPTEAFAHDCLINLTRTFALGGDVTDIIVPDCDTPTNAGWKQRFIDGLSGDISGEGVLHTPSVESWFNWLISNASKNVRIKVDVSGALGGGYWSGAYKLQTFSLTGEHKGLTNASIQLVSHGDLTWTDNP